MDEGKNYFPISQIVIFNIFCILSSIIMLLSFSCSRSSFEFSEEDKEIAKSVSIKTWVEQIGEGDLVFHLKLTNNSEKTLEVEDNIMIGAHMMSNRGDKKMQTVLIVQSKENTSHEERQLMFSTGAPSLIGINNNTIIRIIYGCSGQGIEVINGNKCGNWISSIKPHGSLIIQSKLYTNYEIKTGWVACPGLYFEKGVVLEF